jgi:hypothetical protein
MSVAFYLFSLAVAVFVRSASYRDDEDPWLRFPSISELEDLWLAKAKVDTLTQNLKIGSKVVTLREASVEYSAFRSQLRHVSLAHFADAARKSCVDLAVENGPHF